MGTRILKEEIKTRQYLLKLLHSQFCSKTSAQFSSPLAIVSYSFFYTYLHIIHQPKIATTSNVWLVTGTSLGLGYNLALKTLKKGDKVIAASRDPSRLANLREAGAATVKINQSDPLDTIKKSMEEAIGVYGHVDIIVLNAA